jgi:hypothetical protein
MFQNASRARPAFGLVKLVVCRMFCRTYTLKRKFDIGEEEQKNGRVLNRFVTHDDKFKTHAYCQTHTYK